MQRVIKWVTINGIAGFIVIDGTIGITPFAEQSANMIPFLVSILFGIAIITSVAFLASSFMVEKMDKKKALDMRTKLQKSWQWLIWVDLIYDIATVFLLAAYGFTFSAIFYLIHIPIIWFARISRDSLIDELDAKLAT